MIWIWWIYGISGVYRRDRKKMKREKSIKRNENEMKTKKRMCQGKREENGILIWFDLIIG